MGAKIEAAFSGSSVELIRGGKGDFIVTVEGVERWNKRRTHNDEFPDEDGLVEALKG